ncbi:hypothetical protein BJ508DRAFT_124986 [Ascobolus immersus RN42]|uniref:Fungal N-terminal domain-containing protein n=1 Tax=Ascobolus immersus RN42 TaxID=1160509 RepID=A0A3N4I3N7_ASCIM|nr:hypothetical protein BJ508DRAFT_124986 [Ascobolus immersus RN42]
MEVAAGITGFVCAVGQACQVAAQLHTFFASITDAPARIVQLSEKLDALHSVLARINDIATSLDAECGVEVPADVELALKRTLRKLEDVRRVVRKYDVGIERDGTKWKVKRSWMKIKWAFKEEEVARICGELEAEKAGLGLALQSLGLAVDSMQMKQMEGLQTSMQGLLQTSRTHTELVKSHVDSRFISLERSLNTISGHVEKANTHNMMPEEIMSMIQATVTKSVQEAMTNAMLTGNTPMFGNAFSETPFNLSRESTLYGGEEMRREYSGSTLTGSFSEDDNWKDWKGWPEEMDDIETVCVEPIDKVRFVVPNTDQATKSITRSLRYRHYRRIPTSLGLLLVFYTTASSSSMNWDHGPGERLSSSVFEMGFTFIPAAWLFATAISASFTKTTRFTPSPINDMNINFKSFNVVPTTADVMLYARLGDTLKLRELFSQRIASPNDRDVHGRTPLHASAS